MSFLAIDQSSLERSSLLNWLKDRGEYSVISRADVSSGFLLCEVNKALAVINLSAPEQKPIAVDFSAPAFLRRLRQGVGQKDLLAKAIGPSTTIRHVVDMTAGFGGDSFFFLLMGLSVVAFERHPVVYVLLKDALDRASKHNELARIFNQKMDLSFGESHRLLDEHTEIMPNATIFIDPMFVNRGKSALPSKELQFLRGLLHDDDGLGGSEMLSAALQTKAQRIVVKRHIKSPSLGEAVVHQFKGKTVGYDLYKPFL